MKVLIFTTVIALVAALGVQAHRLENQEAEKVRRVRNLLTSRNIIAQREKNEMNVERQVGVLLRKRVAGVRARPMEATPWLTVAGLVATTRAHADAATQEYATAVTATPTTRSLGQDINRSCPN